MPFAILFTVETVDRETNNEPVYYLINCAHPIHIQKIFENQQEKEWMKRIRDIHGNTSKKSHAELDDGNPKEFAEDINKLLLELNHLNILAGCCGTDIRHIKQICEQCQPIFNQIIDMSLK